MVAGPVEAVDRLQDEEGGAHRRILRRAPVGDVQVASRLEDARRLGEGRLLFLPEQVVEHQRGAQHVDAGVGQGQLLGPSLAPIDRGRAGLARGQREDLGVPVDPDHLCVGPGAGSAIAKVPVPQPTSTATPPSGRSELTRSAIGPRQRRSRMVSAITGS